jgi:hypothetical protein
MISIPTRTPQVRLPMSLPAPPALNVHGKESPPEPAYSLISITLGPEMALMLVEEHRPGPMTMYKTSYRFDASVGSA